MIKCPHYLLKCPRAKKIYYVVKIENVLKSDTECSQRCRNGKWWISENLEMLGKWSNEKVHTHELIIPAYEERMPTRVRNENAHTR